MNADARIRAALEALESGDSAEAVRLLRDAAEESPRGRRRYECPYCAQSFRWPGLRDAHAETCGRHPIFARSAPTCGRAA